MPESEKLADVLRRRRAQRRRLLTRGERRFVCELIALAASMCAVGSAMLLVGTPLARSVGVILLLLTLVPAALPIGPRLRARIRRREAHADPRERLWY